MPWGPSNTDIEVTILAGVPVNLAGSVLSVSIIRGKTDDSGQYGPGTCTVELANPFGELSPTNSASPLFPNVRIGMQLNVRAVNATVGTRPLFFGFVDTLREIAAPKGDIKSSRIVMTASDQFARFAAIEGFERPEVGAGDTSGERVLRLVDINEYKRRQAPIGVRITRRGFGRDRRYPITSGWRLGG
jgi:hypothetical protein